MQFSFDPNALSDGDLLRIFFAIHDPTTLKRQGADVGTPYRLVICYHDDEQRKTAEEVINSLQNQKVWDDPIVTQVVPFQTFYPAEEYHQEYFAQNPMQPYCNIVIAPKVAKFRKQYVEMLKK